MTRLITPFLVALLLASSSVASAQTPESAMPEGTLGEQLTWVLDVLNDDPADITAERLQPHFSPGFLAQVPPETLAVNLATFVQQFGPFTVEEETLVTSRDLPPTAGQVVLIGDDGTRFLAAVVIERETGLINALGIQPAPVEASPVAATPLSDAVVDTDVTFESDGDTIHGSVMMPADATGAGYGALIISGSGPTDRDGNSGSLTSMNTNLNIATALAENGVTSLRYDKLGSGETGMATRTDFAEITASLFLDEARDAANYLGQHPAVDPSKLILVGHSEGALFALVLADEMSKAGSPPAGVALVSPLSIRYLDLLQEQVTTQYEDAVAAGAVSQDEADAATTELGLIVESIRSDGSLPGPIQTPGLGSLFPESSVAVLAEADQWDPAAYAAELPSDLPVLVMHGGKDEQVTPAQVDSLMAGFDAGGNDSITLVEIPNANHLMKIVEGAPNAAVDYANPDLLFAPEAVAALADFVSQLDSAP